jgi:hypothetical protein
MEFPEGKTKGKTMSKKEQEGRKMEITNEQIARVLYIALLDLKDADANHEKSIFEIDPDKSSMYYRWGNESEYHAKGIIDTVNNLIDPHFPTFDSSRTYEIQEFVDKWY